MTKAFKLGSALGTLTLALVPLAAVSSAIAAPEASPPVWKPSASTWPAPQANAASGSRSFSRDLSGTFNGKTVRYTAFLEETIVKDRDGKPASSIFSTSFVGKEGPSSKRSVVFIFNGGPGGASTPLMFGALGPRRMTSFTSEAQADPTTPTTEPPTTAPPAANDAVRPRFTG